MSTTASSALPASLARYKDSTYLIAVGAALLFIFIGTIATAKDSGVATFLFDHDSKSFFEPIYPVTIQNALYIMFALGLADLWVRYQASKREEAYLAEDLLPEGDDVIALNQLGQIRRKIAALDAPDDAILPKLIDESILQLQNSKSLEQAVAIFTSLLDLMTHKLDLAYQTIRYLVWIIPTTGFIGTVVGIAISLEGLAGGSGKIDIDRVASGLKVAFYTTILALLLSAILVLFQNVVQRKEEGVLNEAAQYCLKNLINRVYTGK